MSGQIPTGRREADQVKIGFILDSREVLRTHRKKDGGIGKIDSV